MYLNCSNLAPLKPVKQNVNPVPELFLAQFWKIYSRKTILSFLAL